MISSVSVESWPAFTDHKLVTAYSYTSFELGTAPEKEEIHLLECVKKLKRLNFDKTEWSEVQAELGEVDWTEMEEASKASPTSALSICMNELIPVLERHVPIRKPQKKLEAE